MVRRRREGGRLILSKGRDEAGVGRGQAACDDCHWTGTDLPYEEAERENRRHLRSKEHAAQKRFLAEQNILIRDHREETWEEMTPRPKVLKRGGLFGKVPSGAKFVGRPSKWGNPFRIAPEATPQERQACIDEYRVYVVEELKAGRLNIEELRGADLVCHCAPLPCHADVLVDLANRPRVVA